LVSAEEDTAADSLYRGDQASSYSRPHLTYTGVIQPVFQGFKGVVSLLSEECPTLELPQFWRIHSPFRVAGLTSRGEPS